MEVDDKNLDDNWKEYMRIRVAIDVRKPIKHKTEIKERGVHGVG